MNVYRTEAENDVGRSIQGIFESSTDSIETRLENFPKYVRRQQLKRFLAMYEVFKRVLPVKGSIIECGVFRGFGVMSWAKLSTILEPENLTRRIYGFDTFAGFPSVSTKDASRVTSPKIGDLKSSSFDELQGLIAQYDRDRFLGHIPKIELIKGDITKTAPAFIESHPHLLVSLLYVDCDLFEPTKAALTAFVPRMPKGAIVAFDELDNPLWPGETLAALECMGAHVLKLQRFDWDPYISFAEIGA